MSGPHTCHTRTVTALGVGAGTGASSPIPGRLLSYLECVREAQHRSRTLPRGPASWAVPGSEGPGEACLWSLQWVGQAGPDSRLDGCLEGLKATSPSDRKSRLACSRGRSCPKWQLCPPGLPWPPAQVVLLPTVSPSQGLCTCEVPM